MSTVTSRVYQFTDEETLRLHNLVDDHCQALKNWIASNVEQKNWDRAFELTKELRVYQKLFSKSNVLVHREQAERETLDD